MTDRLTLSKEDIDQIKIVSDSASKAAAEALTKLINKPTDVEYPSLSLKPIDEFSKLNSTNLLAICEITGDVNGNLIIAHPMQSGLKLVEHMMCQPDGTICKVDENVISAYSEFVNIIGGAYLSNLANFLGFRIFPAVPKFIGELNKVQTELYEDLKKDVGSLLMIKTVLSIEDEQLHGDFFIILDEQSLQKIVKTIRDQN